MIKFNKKSDYIEMKSLKDFSPISMEKFFKFRGRELYDFDKPVISTQPSDTNFSRLKKGKLDIKTLKDTVKDVVIKHPANNKDYNASQYIYLNKKKDYDLNLDLVFKITKSGLIILPEFDYYIFLLCTLMKYRKSDSFDYKFIIRGNNNPSLIITVPKTKQGYEELIKALTEFCASLRLFLGSIYYIYLVQEEVPEEKNFSVIDKVTSFIPTITSLAYKFIISPILSKRISMKWDKLLKVNYNPKLVPNLISYINKNYNDKLLVSDCASFSYFINMTKGEDAKRIRKMFSNPVFLGKYNIIPERRRCGLDWWAYAALGIDNNGVSRDIIMISDLDPIPAIFHEFGHFLENHENYLGKMQRASHHGVFSDLFVSTCSFFLGLGGALVNKGVTGEIAGIVSSILLKFPTLQAEFMASYYGLQMMKEMGATDKEVENAKEALKTAYSSYIMSTLSKSTNSGVGRVMGEIIKK